MNLYISRIQDINYSINGYLGEEAAFVGFPGIEGNSSIIQPGSYLYAISENSANKQGAWDFVKYYLSPEYQNSDENWSLPVMKSAFEAQALKATEKPFWIDENGEKVEYDDYFYLNGESIVIDRFTYYSLQQVKSRQQKNWVVQKCMLKWRVQQNIWLKMMQMVFVLRVKFLDI